MASEGVVVCTCAMLHRSLCRGLGARDPLSNASHVFWVHSSCRVLWCLTGPPAVAPEERDPTPMADWSAMAADLLAGEGMSQALWEGGREGAWACVRRAKGLAPPGAGEACVSHVMRLEGEPRLACPPPRGLHPGRSLRDEIFSFLRRTALMDRPKGPPTANRQPPTATNRQRRPTANCQPLPPTTNHQSPTTNGRQPPPTATNHQLPTANRQSPPTANRQPPPTMVEHMECPRAFLGKLEHFFFLSR